MTAPIFPTNQPTTHKMQTAPVTEKSIIARINRRLKPDLTMLRKSRGARTEASLGEFYVIDLRRNAILDRHVDPESYARELGVLRGYEFEEGTETRPT